MVAGSCVRAKAGKMEDNLGYSGNKAGHINGTSLRGSSNVRLRSPDLALLITKYIRDLTEKDRNPIGTRLNKQRDLEALLIIKLLIGL